MQVFAKCTQIWGHPSNHALARATRLTGDGAAAVRAALQPRCDVRDRQNNLRPHLPARLRTDREFGDTAAKDLFVLADYAGNQLSFTNFVSLPKSRLGPLLQTLDFFLWRAAKVDSQPRSRICTQNTSPDAHTRTFFSLSVSHFTHWVKRVRVLFSVFTSISFLDVVVECSLSSFPTSPILTCQLTVQTFSVLKVHGKKLQREPLCIRSLEWVVWPSG